MSYNGIGLQTPRGSGTSGYVQKNIAANKSEGIREKRRREAADEHRKIIRTKMAEARRNAGADVRSHDQKRRIEVKCMELRETLEEQDLEDAEIDKRVAALRTKMVAEQEILQEKERKRAEEREVAENLKTTERSQSGNETNSDVKSRGSGHKGGHITEGDRRYEHIKDAHRSTDVKNGERDNHTKKESDPSLGGEKSTDASSEPLYNYIPRSADR